MESKEGISDASQAAVAAVLGDVHVGFAKAASPGERLWRAGIVSDGYPWWGLVVHALNARVEVTVLRKELTPKLLGRISPGSNVSEMSSGMLPDPLAGHTVDFALIDGCPPKISSGFWNREELRLVVCTSNFSRGRQAPESEGWVYGSFRVGHQTVGGVTDGNFVLHYWCRASKGPTPHLIEPKSKPRQDLRAVMKANVFGKPSKSSEMSREVGTKVLKLAPGIVSMGGLYPVKDGPPSRVRTRAPDSGWVERLPSLDETLAMWDVPENISKGLPEDDKASLVKSVQVPMRARRELCVGLARILRLDHDSSSVPRVDLSPDSKSVPHGLVGLPAADGFSVLVETVDEWLETQEEDAEPASVAPAQETAVEEPVKPAANRTAKATKNDDAEVPVALWDARLEAGLDPIVRERDWRRHLPILRRFWLKRYKRLVLRSALDWIKGVEKQGMTVSPKAMDAIREGIYRIGHATWWEWTQGSTPFFWRWPEEFQDRIRDGIKLWMTGRLKTWQRPQRGGEDEPTLEKVLKKLDKIRERGYVEAGYVESLISFFSVTKGVEDIRNCQRLERRPVGALVSPPDGRIPPENSGARNLPV
jgi:hypothetical protein